MPRPRRPVSPVPEEEDQLQDQDEVKGWRRMGLFLEGVNMWEGGKMEETGGVDEGFKNRER